MLSARGHFDYVRRPYFRFFSWLAERLTLVLPIRNAL